ncbi:conserved hypothetical protein [Sulfurovum sp. enrichment culture clone C5]|uniref:Uncharacterized protein n=1 Tax=Sulfurovum sp. enrichment culture clone C5 TaxID=497650 RepID=A0A0S4XN87_9BACT|nr:conserved hypothetical protein [Sulfurovum sp. enrichment culture clone C5]
MKLIIKEYLSLLKESKELDSLIPELLLAMGHEVISKPHIGVNQFGVDVVSISNNEIYLFTIKQGNIARGDWNTGDQAVKPSLDSILNVYIHTHLEEQYKNLPIKIILATNGDMEQTIKLEWSQYTINNSKDKIKFEFWGGDKLAIEIEEYIFNEFIIPKEQRSLFRKALALIGDTDYDLRDYYQFLDEILFKNELEKESDKVILKALRLVYLSLNIVVYWSQSENNLKPGLLATERTLLNIYEFLYKNNFMKKRKFKEILDKVYEKNFQTIESYCKKIYPLIEVENGLSFRGHDFLQESLILFEQLGILALYGNLYYLLAYTDEDNFDYRKYEGINTHLKLMIKNHKGLYNPVYDEHIIDISLALHLLYLWDEIEFIDEWIYNLISHIEFAYYQGSYFPIDTNNFEDLVECNLGGKKEKKEYIVTSTLIPTLAFWCVKLGLIENYKYLYKVSQEIYKDSTLQIWFADKDIENFVYKMNASSKSGYVFAPLPIYENISQMGDIVEKLKNSGHLIKLENIEMPILYFISSRYFRMPVLPHVLIDSKDIL